MADKLILVDTSILIDYYRKTNKTNSAWFGLIDKDYEFAISSITKYELYSGAAQSQIDFWNSILAAIPVIPFDESCVDKAITDKFNFEAKTKTN